MKLFSVPALPSRHDGFALFAVLWFLVLFSAFGLWILAGGRGEIALARNILAASHAEMLADGGVAEAVFRLTDPAAATQWLPNGVAHNLKTADGTSMVTITDEAGKINPNLASDTLIAALLEVCGVDAGKAAHLGASIADWVDDDDDQHPFGAESAAYQAAGKGYAPHNAPMESLDELYLVLDASRDAIDVVKPYLSIFVPDTEPNSPYMAEPVKRALALAKQRVPGSVTTGDDSTANTDQAGVSGTPADNKNQPTIVSIRVEAHSADGAAFVRNAVIATPGDPPKGYTVLDWQRSDLAPHRTCQIVS